LKPPFKRF